MVKKILILHTGGTISMSENADGHVSPSATNPIASVNEKPDQIEVTNLEVFNLPSPHISPNHMLKLYQLILDNSPLYDGIVITHGTDTLEETAYFLDTMQIPQLPIVLTGAMRSSNELGSDGISNYQAALRVAADFRAQDKGVLVVMNEEIHAAKYVTKTHTTNLSTFQSPLHGPLGLVSKNHILFFKQAEERVRFHLDQISGLVPILKIYAGMEESLLDMLDKTKLSGLVIEAMGAGNIPPKACQALKEFLDAGIPVVLVSRCFNGIAEPVYAYPGGGVQLQEMGILFVKELNAPKARLKLLIALNAGLTGNDLQNYIEG